MKSNIRIIALLICCAFLFAGCKTSKKTVENPEYNTDTQRFESVINSYGKWESLTVNGKVNINVGKEFGSSMQMKMVKGKSISISIRPMLGIEMIKMYITSDSIYMLDKMNKRYVAENLSRFTQGIPFDITTMQDLFLNRIFTLNNGTLKSTDRKSVNIKSLENGNWLISPNETVDKYGYSFLLNNENNLISLLVEAEQGKSPYTVNYSDFKATDAGKIASRIEMKAVVGELPFSMEISFDPSRVKWNQDFYDKLEINDNYRRTSVEAYMSLLKNL